MIHVWDLWSVSLALALMPQTVIQVANEVRPRDSPSSDPRSLDVAHCVRTQHIIQTEADLLSLVSRGLEVTQNPSTCT